MRCSILIVETCPGSAAALAVILNHIDARNSPAVIRVTDIVTGKPKLTLPDIYELIAEKIESFLAERLRDISVDYLVCVLDDNFAGVCNPLGAGGLYEEAISGGEPHKALGSIIGQSILAFPEFRWCVATSSSDFAELLDFPAHATINLFDSYGISNGVRKEIQNDDNRQSVALRNTSAAIVEDETDYSLFHAYTAYRFGFRSYVLTRSQRVYELFGVNGSKPDDFVLSIEDIFLNFPDRGDDRNEHLSNLGGVNEGSRRRKLPKLSEACYRVFVSTGERLANDAEKRAANRRYIAGQDCAVGDPSRMGYLGEAFAISVAKPTAGLFDLWSKAKLNRRLKWVDEVRGPTVTGVGAGFSLSTDRPEKESEEGHSAPGRLLQVAERLLKRANRLLHEDVSSVTTAVHGAVLATNALELLGNKTPTTSLEALALKHQFEIIAECQFVGIQEHMNVHDRLNEIARDVRSLGRWFGDSRSEGIAAQWNAEMCILNKLIVVFNEHNQFDEEQVIRTRARYLLRKLWFHAHPYLKFLEFAPWYVEKLVDSFPRFLAAMAIWILVLGWAYSHVGHFSLDRGLANALGSFLGIQPPSDPNLWNVQADGWNAAFSLIALTIVSGFVHLGIFISFIYSLITRK